MCIFSGDPASERGAFSLQLSSMPNTSYFHVAVTTAGKIEFRSTALIFRPVIAVLERAANTGHIRTTSFPFFLGCLKGQVSMLVFFSG